MKGTGTLVISLGGAGGGGGINYYGFQERTPIYLVIEVSYRVAHKEIKNTVILLWRCRLIRHDKLSFLGVKEA